MGDIGDMPKEYIKKKKEFEKDELQLKNKAHELRILELKQEIKKIEFEIQVNNDAYSKIDEELKLYDKQIEKEVKEING